MHSFGDITFKEERNLATAVDSARICLTEDTDPPVIVEAAIALQFLIEKQEGCKLGNAVWYSHNQGSETGFAV